MTSIELPINQFQYDYHTNSDKHGHPPHIPLFNVTSMILFTVHHSLINDHPLI